MTTIFRVGAASTGPAGNGAACAFETLRRPPSKRWRGQGRGSRSCRSCSRCPMWRAKTPPAGRHLAEPLDGPTARWAADLSSRLGIPILFGMALAGVDGGKPFNAALLARPGGTVEPVAHKIHLPPAGPGEAFGEADHFAAGPPCVGTVEVGPVRLAVLICYDRRFPECWRAAASAGADVVAVLVAGPAPADPDGIFLAELRTHARANAVYAVAAARFGTETITGSPVRHDGETAAVTPDGGIAADRTDDHHRHRSGAAPGRAGPQPHRTSSAILKNKESIMGDLIVQARWVVTGTADRHTPVVIDQGAVLSKDGVVKATGTLDEMKKLAPGATVKSYPDHVMLPGFVNSHHHVGLTPFQLGSPDYALELWFASRMAAREVDLYLDTLYSAFEMIESGITTVQHIHGWVAGALRARSTDAAEQGAEGLPRHRHARVLLATRCATRTGWSTRPTRSSAQTAAEPTRRPSCRAYLKSQAMPLADNS